MVISDIENILCFENISRNTESETGFWIKNKTADKFYTGDKRILKNLLQTESCYKVKSKEKSQIKEKNRKILACWMVEVCEEHSCGDDVFPLAVGLLDRFLSVINVKDSFLQIFACVSLFISSKIRLSIPLSVDALSEATDYSVTSNQILECELLFLDSLSWDLNLVTAYDFLSPLIYQLAVSKFLPDSSIHTIRSNSQIFILMCLTEGDFSSYSTSILSSACIATALHCYNKKTPDFNTELVLKELQDIIFDRKGKIFDCWCEIEAIIESYSTISV